MRTEGGRGRADGGRSYYQYGNSAGKGLINMAGRFDSSCVYSTGNGAVADVGWTLHTEITIHIVSRRVSLRAAGTFHRWAGPRTPTRTEVWRGCAPTPSPSSTG